MRSKIFLNLTNGIEAIPWMAGGFSFIRIQSSQCEAKDWLKVLMGVDNDFLMWVALGYECTVYDFSQRKESPRALFQGLSLVEYVLNRRWYGLEEKVIIKGNMNVTTYFEEVYLNLFRNDQTKEKEHLKAKLDYFKKYCMSDRVHIKQIGLPTMHDGDNAYYKSIMKKFVNG